MSATEVRARLHRLLDYVEQGEEIEITRYGRTVASLAPARGPHPLKGRFAGVAMSAAGDANLYSTGAWDMPSPRAL
jgi:prevent-host-death family protein